LIVVKRYFDLKHMQSGLLSTSGNSRIDNAEEHPVCLLSATTQFFTVTTKYFC